MLSVLREGLCGDVLLHIKKQNPREPKSDNNKNAKILASTATPAK